MFDMTGLSGWLSETAASQGIQNAGWIIPTSQCVHILAVSILMASSLMLNMRLAGLIGYDDDLRYIARRFLPWIWWSLPVLLVTGIVQITGEPERELLNRFFWYKMISIVVVSLITIPLNRLLIEQPFRDMPRDKRETVRALAVVSLGIWLFIVFCGRWIAYAV